MSSLSLLVSRPAPERRQRRSRFAIFTAVALAGALAAACGGDDDDSAADAAPRPDAAPPDPAVTVFTPPTPGAGADWGVIPYPNDLFLNDEGKLALLTLPHGPNYDEAFAGRMLEALHSKDGAGVWTNVYFPIEGDLDPATLDGHVKMVDLDNDLAEIDADLLWRADLGMIVVAPKLGTVLLEQHNYAAYVTEGITTTEGAALVPNDAFQAAFDLDNPPSDPALLAAQQSLTPLIEALPEATASQLVAATVFRTLSVTPVTLAMRDIVKADIPTITITTVQTDPTQYMGVLDPSEPPGLSSNGVRAQRSENVEAIVHGVIQMPNFVSADPVMPGFVEYDSDGKPIVKGHDPVAFTLVLPKAASYANLPVMIMQHGVNTTRIRTLVCANAAAAQGMAVLGIDLPYHGSRADGAVDSLSLYTGESEPDGFGDPIGLLAAAAFFHLGAKNGIGAFHPLVMLENLRRSSLNQVSLVTWVQEGSVDALNTALEAAGLPHDLSFRQDTVALWSRSFGSQISALTTAIEPGIGAAELDVPSAGFIYPTLLQSGEFGTTFDGVVYETLDISSQVETGGDDLAARFHPVISLWLLSLAEGDALSYAPYMLDGSLRGGTKTHYVMTMAYSDEWVPNLSTLQLANAMGLQEMPLALDDPPPDYATDPMTFTQVSSPASANIGGDQTGVFMVVKPATHGFSFWWDDYFTYQPDGPPWIFLPELQQMHNYTTELQGMAAAFLADYYAGGGAPAVTDPFAE